MRVRIVRSGSILKVLVYQGGDRLPRSWRGPRLRDIIPSVSEQIGSKTSAMDVRPAPGAAELEVVYASEPEAINAEATVKAIVEPYLPN
jgi:hypothetical protein